MPKVMHVLNGQGVLVAYTVKQPVGPGCANKREDVLLVQHLLRVAWEDAATSKGFRSPGETQPPKDDGICGPTTNKFIKFFQQEAKRRGANCSQDGRVDPVVSGGSISAGSHTFYIVLAMNAARNSRRASNLNDIGGDAGCPADLRKALYINW
jgi:hypothetical protein